MDTICRRDIKLSDYNISRAKYNELKYFCIQYAEKKQKLQNAYGLKATVNDGMPKSNLSGDSTAQEAVRNAMMQEDIQLIEETARKASPEIYKWILRNVTEGTPYEWMDVPVGRRQFYEYRRYFFYLLAQKIPFIVILLCAVFRYRARIRVLSRIEEKIRNNDNHHQT